MVAERGRDVLEEINARRLRAHMQSHFAFERWDSRLKTNITTDISMNIAEHVLAYDDLRLPALERVAHAMAKPSTVEAAIDAVQQLISKLNVPSSLRELGVSEEFMPYMVEDAFESTNAQLVNPRKATKEEIATLYRQSFCSNQ